MEFQKDQAIYLQIADLICENILSGDWTKEEKIPSVREMAVTIEVNPNTVMRTYAYLQEKGIIYNRRGIGYFISDDAKEITRTLKRKEFINTQLPQVFKMMDLLNIDFNELKTFYNNQ
ncbi:MAG: GntR family transcriptional regulator [Candidatus Marinimicrobia bacterium]|nr:GntR family transcriptional regulator [Candidatus Neomarinimicrobiota bacterium]